MGRATTAGRPACGSRCPESDGLTPDMTKARVAAGPRRRKPDDLQGLVLAAHPHSGAYPCGHRTHDVATEHTPHRVRLHSLTGHGPRTAQTERDAGLESRSA